MDSQAFSRFAWAAHLHYRAQRGRCPYCGHTLEMTRRPPRAAPKISWDHVFPKSGAGRGRLKNKLLAHPRCNGLKANRLPTACERLFLEVTNEIVDALKKSDR